MSHRYRRWEPLFPPATFARGPLLVLAPHPDDEVIGCGGLILAHRDADQPVVVAVLTDGRLGDVGGRHGEGYVELRREECRRAALALGGAETLFLDLPDGGLPQALDDGRLLQCLRGLLSLRSFATVAFPSPYELHPDHRALGIAALLLAAETTGPTRFLAYEIGTFMPANVLLDVSALAARKDRALGCYESQMHLHDLTAKVRGVDVARTANVDDRNIQRAEAYLLVEAARAPELLRKADDICRITDDMMPPVPWE